MQKAAETWLHYVCIAETERQLIWGDLYLCAIIAHLQLFRHRWYVSNAKKITTKKQWSIVDFFSSVQGRRGNILTFLCNENCWSCHDISSDRLESFLLQGINHWWEDYSSVPLMAKLESAGFLVTQTYSVLFLHTTSCTSSWPEWNMNFSIVTCLLVSFHHTCNM